MATRKNKHMRIHQSFPQPGNEQPSHLGSQSMAPTPMAPGTELNPGQPPNPDDVLGSSQGGY